MKYVMRLVLAASVLTFAVAPSAQAEGEKPRPLQFPAIVVGVDPEAATLTVKTVRPEHAKVIGEQPVLDASEAKIVLAGSHPKPEPKPDDDVDPEPGDQDEPVQDPADARKGQHPRPGTLADLAPGAKVNVHAVEPAEDDGLWRAVHVVRLPVGPTPEGDRPGPTKHEDGKPAGGFKQGFLNRVWTVQASVTSYSDGVLNATISKFAKLPKKYKAQDDELVETDSMVLVSKATRVYDSEGKRLSAEQAAAALEAAETVKLQVKLLPFKKWKSDEDDVKVPTYRAKRVTVIS